MNQNRCKTWLAIAAAALFALPVIGCSSDDSNNGPAEDDAGVNQILPDTKPPIADLAIADGAGAACGPETYPCGPYGTKEGEILEDITFFGFTDPNTFCKKTSEKRIDLASKVEFSFGEFFRAPADCPQEQKKLLWVMVSAAWCGPCIQEIRAVMQKYRADELDPRLELLDIIFEDKNSDPITEATAKKWITEQGIAFPVVLDPSFKMGKFFKREAIPFNMLVDLRTMKIILGVVGNQQATLQAQISAFLADLD